MRYNDFHGEKISALGFGCMRLPVLDNDQSRINMPKVEEMFLYAVEHGSTTSTPPSPTTTASPRWPWARSWPDTTSGTR